MLMLIAGGYFVIMSGMLLSEHGRIQTAVGDAKQTVMLAANSALNQVLASDEFFTSVPNESEVGNMYSTGDSVTALQISRSTTDTKYSYSNIFSEVWDYDVTNNNWQQEKEDLFVRMYGNSAYSTLAQPGYMNLAKQITFDYNGVKIPNIARMGLLQGYDTADDGDNTFVNLKDLYDTIFAGRLTLQPTYKNDYKEVDGQSEGYRWQSKDYARDTDWLGLFSIKKGTEKEPYFLAPTNVGVTYVDPALLETAFVCNMDLLMRSKYILNDTDEGLQAGVGIPTTGFEGTFSTLDDKAMKVVEDFNIIHNGTFSFVKGAFVGYSNNTPGGFTGGSVDGKRVLPRVDYQLITLRDETGKIKEDNANLLCSALGINFENVDKYVEWVANTTAENFLLARVTFYADIFVPYSTQMARELYYLYEREDKKGEGAKLFQVHNIKQDETDASSWKISDVTGNALYEYTTYFAVVA